MSAGWPYTCCNGGTLIDSYPLFCCVGFAGCNAGNSYICTEDDQTEPIWCPGRDLCALDTWRDFDFLYLPCPTDPNDCANGLDIDRATRTCCAGYTLNTELQCCEGYDYCGNGQAKDCVDDGNGARAFCPAYDYCANGPYTDFDNNPCPVDCSTPGIDRNPLDGTCCVGFERTDLERPCCVGFDYCAFF